MLHIYFRDNTPEEILRSNFFNIGRNPAAFSTINYVGTRTTTQSTDFSILLNEVKKNLKNSTVRSARPVSVIFNALMVSKNFLYFSSLQKIKTLNSTCNFFTAVLYYLVFE